MNLTLKHTPSSEHITIHADTQDYKIPQSFYIDFMLKLQNFGCIIKINHICLFLFLMWVLQNYF